MLRTLSRTRAWGALTALALALTSTEPAGAFVLLELGSGPIPDRLRSALRWPAAPVLLPDGSTGYVARVAVGVQGDFAQRMAVASGFANPTPEQIALTWDAVDAAFRVWENGAIRFDVNHQITGTQQLSLVADSNASGFFGTTSFSRASGTRVLTNGESVQGGLVDASTITIYLGTISGFLSAVSGLSDDVRARMLTRLIAHEVGHSLGLGHVFESPFIDNDLDPTNEMLIDPRDPFVGLGAPGGGYDDSAIMMRYVGITPPLASEEIANLTRTQLTNDDRAARDVLYPNPRLPLCVPEAAGVPGMSGPPNWWDGAGSADDPRWQGALAVGHANGHARFRALRASDTTGETHLFLSWEVAVDPGGASDGVSVAFYDPATQNGNAFQFSLKTDVDLQGGTLQSGDVSVQGYYRSLYTPDWTPVPAAAALPWLDETAGSFVKCDAGACTWSLQVRLPIDPDADPADPVQGLPLSNEFHYWHDLQVFGGPIVVKHSWPEWEAGELPFAAQPDVFRWQRMQLQPGIPCRETISLDRSQITTDNPQGSQTIGANNTFHARPTNRAGRNLDGDDIEARIRIANWGSVMFSSPEWRDVSAECSTASGDGATVVADGSNFDLVCTWIPTAAELCQYDSDCPGGGSYHSHQCILVELSTADASEDGIVFSPSSAYRNMEVVGASTFERNAVVSVSGLQPITGASSRDVYLFIETHNLPSPARVREQNNGALSASIDPKLRQQLANGEIPLERLAQTVPTYRVHVFHETGATVQLGGRSYAVVNAQPSFGYFVTHEGELSGWQHSIQGVSLEQLSDRLYRVAVPNDGQIRLKTIIEAVEPRTPRWWWVILAMLLVALTAWITRRLVSS